MAATLSAAPTVSTAAAAAAAIAAIAATSSTSTSTSTSTTTSTTTATATDAMANGVTTSVSILVGTSTGGGGNASSSSSSSSSSSAYYPTVPIVVWVCHERTRSHQTDPWRHTLEYFELLDDTARWTHLDQLLLRFGPHAVHVGSSESLLTSSTKPSKKGKTPSSSSPSSAKTRRLERLMEGLQVFLDERQTTVTPPPSSSNEEEEFSNSNNNNNNSNSNSNQSQDSMACHFHPHVPVDSSKVETAMSQLLLPDADVQLSYRGNVDISTRGSLLQQGLALWLHGEGLYPPSSPTDAWMQSLRVQPGTLRSHLVMDRTAAACIHLLPPANAGVASVVGGTAHNNSLYGVLSKPCATAIGRQQLHVWLRQPLIDRKAILRRQDAVTNLLQGVGKDALRDALKGFASVELPHLAAVLGEYTPPPVSDQDQDHPDTLSNTAHTPNSTNTKKPLKALYQLYLLSATQLPQLKETMESFDVVATSISNDADDSRPSLLQEAKEQVGHLLAELDRCQGLVEAVLDLDQAPRQYLIQPTFSPDLEDLYQELRSIRGQVDDQVAEMQDVWEQACGQTSPPSIRLEEVNQQDSAGGGTWQFRVPDTNATKIVPSLSLPGIQLHRILKNGVYFSTKALRQLGTTHQDLSVQYARQSQQVVADAMRVASTYQTVVERTAQLVSTLDCLMALAQVAAYSPHGYCKPILTDTDDSGAGIVLKAARHPCVELQEDMEFIPNDVALKFGGDGSDDSNENGDRTNSANMLDDDKDSSSSSSSSSNFLLVTGPNMGGKSTYIRALGAIVCLAQIGSYVPCDSATINICHALLARVGAGDLQERGISTFMAEMLEASSILRTATKRSLVVIDELGRGTSTFDGYGLARAISEYLQHRIGCLTVFATHFHELTQQLTNVSNCHVTAHASQGGLTFLYAVQPGPCLESFGIQVAEMAQVPRVVIDDAKRKAAALEDFGKKCRRSRNQKKNKANSSHDDEYNNSSSSSGSGSGSADFVQRFCQLDVPGLLRNSSKEATKAKLLQLLLTTSTTAVTA